MNDFFPRCQHLTLSGARCTSPALRDREFCYSHHYRRLRRARNSRPWHPGDREVAGPLVTFVYMEDHASVLENINLIAQAFAEHSIDHRQASSMTYLMNTALKTLDRLHHLQRVSPEEMPTVVAHDDLDEPMATPDRAPAPTPNSCHPESAPAGEGSYVPACHPESAQAGEGAAVAFPISKPAISDQEPIPHVCHPESEPAAEGPCAPACHPDAELREAEGSAVAFPETSSLLPADCNEETLATLTAAAEPNRERPDNSHTFNDIDKSLSATTLFSITCAAAPSATHSDSTLAQKVGGYTS